MKRLLLAALCAATLLLPGAAAGGGAAPLRILFVGNSLTAANDLPVVAALGARTGTPIVYEARTPGGYSLEDDWTLTDVARRSRMAAGTGW